MFGDVAPLTDPQQLIASGPVVDCFSWTLFPGEPLERAPERLEYVATRVIPAVRADSAPAGRGATRSPGS